MVDRFTSTASGAFILIMVINVLSRGLGFLREVLFANFFGLGIDFDIYLVGAVFPIMLNTVILYLGLNYFIPTFNRIKATGNSSPESFFKLALFIFTVSGILLSVLIFIFSEVIVQHYLNTSDPLVLEKALSIFRILLITVPLTSAISIITAFEQAKYQFKHPALSRMFLNVTMIPILLLFTDQFGIYTIPIGFVLGTFFQLLYLIFKSKIRDVTFNFFISNIGDIGKYFDLTIFSVLLIEIIGQIYVIADRYFFGSVNEGGISALNYGFNIFLLPISIITIALATVIFPKVSENISRGEYAALSVKISSAVRANLLILVPVSLLFFLFGDTIINILFERGKFTSGDTEITFSVLKIYSFSLIFYSIYSIFNKIIYGAKLINSLLIITLGGILIKVILNIILVTEYQQNGLALSTSISFTFFFISSLVLIQKKLQVSISLILLSELLFHLLNGFVTYLLVSIIFSEVQSSLALNLLELSVFMIIYYLNINIIGHNAIDLLRGIYQNFKSVKKIS
ncbi:MAG: polysaccharide biosynthesis C-terminal domain-containing protein [Bacteroidetes bacterium]|nr:polysaccharide biosynthesis C-terminal domain-containing protein [Bacteroidota bacterium]